MNYIEMLMKILAFIPAIAHQVEKNHSVATVETKSQIASDYLNLAAGIATAILPSDQASLASIAGNAAQTVLATTVQAIHAANQPTLPVIIG